VLDAQEKNLTLEEFAMDTIQDFMRAALSPTNNANKCDTTKAAGTTTTTTSDTSSSVNGGFDLPPPPLVIHWNDYLGNEQHEVRPTTTKNRADVSHSLCLAASLSLFGSFVFFHIFVP
jgi:hypothetical protein